MGGLGNWKYRNGKDFGIYVVFLGFRGFLGYYDEDNSFIFLF